MMGERLTYLLQLLGVSGKTLAAQIGVDESTLSKWRRGKRALKYSSYALSIDRGPVETQHSSTSVPLLAQERKSSSRRFSSGAGSMPGDI